jgi:hypothetical protein
MSQRQETRFKLYGVDEPVGSPIAYHQYREAQQLGQSHSYPRKVNQDQQNPKIFDKV